MKNEWNVDFFIKVNIYVGLILTQPVPLASLSKAYVYGRSPAEIVGSKPTGGMDVCLLCVLCAVR